ncbi:MAG: branched-chain amino acid ABC transporter permease [Pseudomonadota bacterium]
MNLQIVALLGQDGATNGAIYALLALALVMVFAVTRILFIPQGEFVAFGALTMGAIQSGKPLTVVWLLAGLCLASAAQDVGGMLLRRRAAGPRGPHGASAAPGRALAWPLLKLGYAGTMVWLAFTLPSAGWPMAAQALLTMALLVPLGPLLYRLVFQPVASASPLVLLIVSIALHVVLVGVGLLVFGPEGAHTRPFSDDAIDVGTLRLNSQALWVIGIALALIAALYLLFERTLYGKALRAAAMNRMGARLMGISPAFAGQAMFFMAALIGVLSGVLIAPVTTIYYDSGFLISLKGFVGAIIGGLVSYPLAAAGALLVGLIEAFSAFVASTYKEVIVFMLIIPVLMWRSLNTRHVEEDE